MHKVYQEILKQEELLWFQKSREQWVTLVDRNNKFFHTHTVIRRRRNKIQGLHLEDGSWCTNEVILHDYAINFYQTLFQCDHVVSPDCLVDILLPNLNDDGKAILSANVDKQEVREAVFGMSSYKAPGPDGFQPLFFKHSWDLVVDDLWDLVKSTFLRGDINEQIAETLLVLIPKGNNPTSLKNFRPICLCNVVFKVITKVLVNRIRPFLDELVGPFLSSFIPKRSTSDNAILDQEVVHYMHTSRSKKGTLAFKIEWEKAYDRLD